MELKNLNSELEFMIYQIDYNILISNENNKTKTPFNYENIITSICSTYNVDWTRVI